MTLQSKSNEEELAEDVVATLDTDGEESEGSNGDSKRRGRAARRRRREEAQAALGGDAIVEAKEEAIEETPRKKEAPTPGRRQRERRNFITRFTNPVTDYLRETMAELRKVTWPSREDSLRLSGIVLGATAIFALVLGLYNYLLSTGLGVLLNIFN